MTTAREAILAMPVGTTFRINAYGTVSPWHYAIDAPGVVSETMPGTGHSYSSPYTLSEYDTLFASYDDTAIVEVVSPVTSLFGVPIEPSPAIVEVPAQVEDAVADNVTITRAEYRRLQEEAVREFSEYDERMRPMIRKLARAATAADFCHEYDRMMAVVNAPHRDEILAREYDIEVEVLISRRVMVTVSTQGHDSDAAEGNVDRDLIRGYLDAEGIEYDDIDDWSLEETTAGDFVEID